MATLKEKIGQMIMIGLKGEALTSEEKRLLKDYPFGGFILFSHNLKEAEQILSLCRSLWERKAMHPPFIGIDQEGGRVHRLPPPFTHFPSAALLGEKKNGELAYRMGLATARELSAVGINLNFAPVLDVHSNPNNPVIGDRSLGSDPKLVGSLGWSIIQGLRTGGVIPCAKHFPGHGETTQDSHLELPIVQKEEADLRAVELPPFIHACRNRVEAVMTAHVLYPALDPRYPATLSRSIITELLRKEIRYEGLVLGDDMEMRAISNNYTMEEAVALSVKAGADMLLFCHQTESALQACEFLLKQAEKDAEMKAGVEESYQRIRKLKERYLALFTGRDAKELEKVIDFEHHRKLAQEIQGSL